MKFIAGLIIALMSVAAIGCKTPEPAPIEKKIETVKFKAEDDLEITADLIKGDSNKGIICVHMFPGSRKDYHKIMPMLADKGYTVLSIDTRGCPKDDTGKEKYEEMYKSFSPELFKIIYKDVLDAKKFLVENYKISPDKVGFIGGSIGCSIVLMAAANDDAVKNIVLMSPGLDWAEIDNVQNMQALKDCKILITYGEEEKGYKENIAKLVEAGENLRIDVHPLPGDAHAGYQFDKNPEVSDLIVKFIEENLK